MSVCQVALGREPQPGREGAALVEKEGAAMARLRPVGQHPAVVADRNGGSSNHAATAASCVRQRGVRNVMRVLVSVPPPRHRTNMHNEFGHVITNRQPRCY